MALLGFEGFDNVSSNFDIAVKPGWTENFNSTSKAAGLLGGSAFTTDNFGGGDITFTPGSNYATLICGFRWRPATATASSKFFSFNDGASVQVGLSLDASGHIQLWRGSTANIIATGTTVITAPSWYFIELKITFHNSAGAYELRIGGTTEFSGTGVDTTNTANAYANNINLRHIALGSRMDDMYLCDDSGSSPLNDFLGVIRIETIYPTGNDSVTFTPSAGSNYQNVDEEDSDDDTSYNSSDSSGDIDLFSHGALSGTPSIIYAVAVETKWRKTDVTDKRLKNKLKSNTTVQDGASNPTTTSYIYYKDIFLVDPDTGVAWTASGVNATKIGYEYI